MDYGLDLAWNNWLYYNKIKEERDNYIRKILKNNWSGLQIDYLMNIRKLYHDMCNLIEDDEILNVIYSYFGTDLVIINDRAITKEEIINLGFLFIYILTPVTKTKINNNIYKDVVQKQRYKIK